MNAELMARAAYEGPSAALRTPRAIEYDVFARVTHRLRVAYDRADGPFSGVAEALHDNRALWNVLASDVSDPQNGMPDDLRARIFYLAEFTRHHSRRVLAGEAGLAPLIEINTAIMKGLRGREAGT